MLSLYNRWDICCDVDEALSFTYIQHSSHDSWGLLTAASRRADTSSFGL